MDRLLRLSALTLLVFALLAALSPRRGAPVVVPRPDAPLGVVRLGGRAQIDLNRADEALLASIPGVGPVLAARIRARIDEKGALTAPEDLLDVEGIGPAKLRAINALSAVLP